MFAATVAAVVLASFGPELEPASPRYARTAADHAYEACRLETGNAEAWSTLSFILERTGKHTDAIAAARRASAW